LEQAADLLERETQHLRALDEANALESVAAIPAVPVHRFCRLRHQPAALVVADRLDVHAGFGGQATDRQFAHHGPLTPYQGADFRLPVSQRPNRSPQFMPRLEFAGSLVAGALAALGASACCFGPLALLVLGAGGAWASGLAVFEALRPWLVAATFVFLGLAFRRLYMSPAPVCATDATCTDPGVRGRQRLMFWIVSAALLALLSVPVRFQALSNDPDRSDRRARSGWPSATDAREAAPFASRPCRC
jgi:mercuric ion transport protein